MPFLHLSVPQYSSLENVPNGSSGGSHNVWATSLNTETIFLGPAPMISSPETSGENRSNPCHSSLLTKQTGNTKQRGNTASPPPYTQLWWKSMKGGTRWEQKVPGLRMSRDKGCQPSQLLLPPQSCPVKRQTRVETHVLLFLSQFLQKVHHFLISQVTGTLPLSRGRRQMMLM